MTPVLVVGAICLAIGLLGHATSRTMRATMRERLRSDGIQSLSSGPLRYVATIYTLMVMGVLLLVCGATVHVIR